VADILGKKTLLYDGAKAVRIADLPDSAWTQHAKVGTEEEAEAQAYYKAVPWLFRGVNLLADAVADMPFALYQGENEYDSSEAWENKVGFLPNPQDLLWMTEAAIEILGTAYLLKLRNRVKILSLRYLMPTTITPQIKDPDGLVGFKRQLATRTVNIKAEDLLYFWLRDPFVELGEPKNTPATAALAAAGVLLNLDRFIAAFFKRGAIKATLLTVEGSPPDSEKDKLKSWWNRVFTGISSAFNTEVISANVEPVTVGEGVKELSNVDLTKDKREDIATALGIPMTILWSSSASGLGGGGVVTEDDKKFYTKTIVPRCTWIASVLNEQIFEPMGLRWAFRPETLDVFQTDENQRSQSFKLYVDAGLKLSVAAEMLGLELPKGVSFDDLDKAKEEAAARAVEQFRQRQAAKPEEERERPTMSQAARDDTKRWQKVAMRLVTGGDDPGAYEFQSSHIPEDVATHIKAMLAGALTEEEVKAAFAAPFPGEEVEYRQWTWDYP